MERERIEAAKLCPAYKFAWAFPEYNWTLYVEYGFIRSLEIT